MSKGSKRRPCQVPKAQYDKNFERVFGKKKLNIMSDNDLKEVEKEKRAVLKYGDRIMRNKNSAIYCNHANEMPATCPCESDCYCKSHSCLSSFWSGPGYRGEYNCPHGVGHGNHIHGCCGFRCCQREDFPLKEKKNMTKHDEFVDRAYSALQAVFGDTSVDRETTKESLEEIIDDIKEMIGSLNE